MSVCTDPRHPKIEQEHRALKAEVEELTQKVAAMDSKLAVERRHSKEGWDLCNERTRQWTDAKLQINVYREELERQKNKNRGMGSIVADEILKRIQSRLEDTEKRYEDALS